MYTSRAAYQADVESNAAWARDRRAKERRACKIARENGAKITERKRGEWVALDQEKYPRLWNGVFKTRGEASLAYCEEHGLAV